jgi:hypothetical protein
MSQQFTTHFASLSNFERGSIEVIKGDAKHYAFSNVFDVASRSAPFEKVVVAKNLEYVIEILRAEGQSEWFAAAHDEFAVALDGYVEVEFLKLDHRVAIAPAATEGTVKAGPNPAGRRMGAIYLKRGHQALLPAGAAYRFKAQQPGVIMLQTLRGELSVEKWGEICIK